MHDDRRILRASSIILIQNSMIVIIQVKIGGSRYARKKHYGIGPI